MRKKNLHRRCVTLIELLIAMTLTALILTVLFYFYRDIDWLNQDMEKSQRNAFRLSYVQNRLADVLPNAVSPRTTDEDFFFFQSGDVNGLLKNNTPSLVFTYQFGANRDPLFANHDLGRLYLDDHSNLSLATMPSPARWPSNGAPKIKNEILLEDVDSLSFQYYVPPQKERSQAGNKAPKGTYGKGKNPPAEIQPKDAWHSDWKTDYHQLPAIVKVIVKMKNTKEPVIFVYPLPNSDFVVVYDK